YDDVLNKQREVVYGRRRELLSADELREQVLEMIDGVAAGLAGAHADAEVPSAGWGWKGIDDAGFQQFALRLQMTPEERGQVRAEGLEELICERAHQAFEGREAQYGAPIMRHLERLILLQTLDGLWRGHLVDMEHLKEGIGLRGYGQKNPLQEYQKEGYDLFA